jgi:hypothetical protein
MVRSWEVMIAMKAVDHYNKPCSAVDESNQPAHTL